MAGHPPGFICLKAVPGSEQVCSELFSSVIPQDMHLPPVPSAASCHPFPLEGLILFAAWLSWAPCPSPEALPSLLTLAVTAGLNPAPALTAAGVAPHCTAVGNTAGASLLLLSWDLTNLLLGEARQARK